MEHRCNEVTAAAHSGFVEDRLEMILHRVRTHKEVAHDPVGRHASAWAEQTQLVDVGHFVSFCLFLPDGLKRTSGAFAPEVLPRGCLGLVSETLLQEPRSL